MSELTSGQAVIYNLLKKGHDPLEISQKLGKDIGIIRAQLTRIENKGFPLTAKIKTRPPGDGSTSNKQVIREAAATGEAEYDIDKAIERAKEIGENFELNTDQHPMVMLGVTLQFMKLCGGRISAHQMIEDVYSALSAMNH